MNRVFVYGTLRGHETAIPAVVKGFVRNDTGPYPAIEPGDGVVYGEIIHVDELGLAQLDRIEGYDPACPEGSFYHRYESKNGVYVYIANAANYNWTYEHSMEEIRKAVETAEIKTQ